MVAFEELHMEGNNYESIKGNGHATSPPDLYPWRRSLNFARNRIWDVGEIADFQVLEELNLNNN